MTVRLPMFESNFPVDKGSYGYGEGWNAPAPTKSARCFTTRRRGSIGWTRRGD